MDFTSCIADLVRAAVSITDIGFERNFAVGSRNVEHVGRQREAGQAAAQFAHQRLALGNRGSEMRGAGRQIAVVQVVGLDATFHLDMRDLEDGVRIARTRLARLGGWTGVVLLGAIAFLLTSLALMGFWYGAEFCQALFLLLAPLPFVLWLRLALARRIGREDLAGEALCHRLALHRVAIQAMGMVAILVTGFWGTWQNFMATPF